MTTKREKGESILVYLVFCYIPKRGLEEQREFLDILEFQPTISLGKIGGLPSTHLSILIILWCYHYTQCMPMGYEPGKSSPISMNRSFERCVTYTSIPTYFVFCRIFYVKTNEPLITAKISWLDGQSEWHELSLQSRVTGVRAWCSPNPDPPLRLNMCLSLDCIERLLNSPAIWRFTKTLKPVI